MTDDLRCLFEDLKYGTVSAQFAPGGSLPDDALISNVSVVPFVGDSTAIPVWMDRLMQRYFWQRRNSIK